MPIPSVILRDEDMTVVGELRKKLQRSESRVSILQRELEKETKAMLEDAKRLGVTLFAAVGDYSQNHLKLKDIFQPFFLYTLMYDMMVEPKVKLKVEELEPYRCNYPPELRSKGVACEKAVARDSVFFCSTRKHQFYARILGLPVSKVDCEMQGFTVPLREVTRHRNNDGAPVKRRREEEEGAMPVNREKAEEVVEEETPDDHDGMMFNDRESKPRCAFENPVNGQVCGKDGVHEDEHFNPGVFMCESHVIVSDDLIASVVSEEAVLQDLQKIRRLDVSAAKEELGETERKRLYRVRHRLASRHNLGTHPAIIGKYIVDDIS